MAEDLKARLISPADVGGLPVFNDDILQAQDNNRNSLIQQCEFLRSRTGRGDGLTQYGSGVTSDLFSNGLIISGCVVDQSAATYVISEGYVYLDGEIMKYEGTSFLGSDWPFGYQVWLKKGTETKVARVFKDGSSKDATTSFVVESAISSLPSSGENPPVGYETNQSICISGAASNAARYYTTQCALGLCTAKPFASGAGSGSSFSGLIADYDNTIFSDGGLEANVTGTIKSRIKEKFESEVILELDVDVSTFDDAVKEYTIGTLSNYNSNYVQFITTYLRADTDATQDLIALIRITTSGVITIRRPLGQGTWVDISGGSVYGVKTQTITYSLPTETTSYDGFDKDFMTIG